jgi:hypothetical protein
MKMAVACIFSLSGWIAYLYCSASQGTKVCKIIPILPEFMPKTTLKLCLSECTFKLYLLWQKGAVTAANLVLAPWTTKQQSGLFLLVLKLP